MKRTVPAASALLVVVSALVVASCGGSSTTSPSTPAVPKFSSTLLPGNEAPTPVTNADATGNGTVAVTLNTTKDASGNVTSATADFSVTLSGFPAGTSLTGAHIHQGVAGVSAGILISTGLANGELVLANGSGSFTKNGINVSAADAQGMINNPAGYYFNVHTTLNPSGAVRGQLVKVQ